MAVRHTAVENAPEPTKRPCIRSSEDVNDIPLVHIAAPPAMHVFAPVPWPLSMLFADHWRMVASWMTATDLLRLCLVNHYFQRLAITMFFWKYHISPHAFTTLCISGRVNYYTPDSMIRAILTTRQQVEGYIAAVTTTKHMPDLYLHDIICVAIRDDLVSSVTLLLDCAGSEHAYNMKSLTKYAAEYNGHLDMFVLLHSRCLPSELDDVDTICLSVAIDHCHTEIVNYLLKADRYHIEYIGYTNVMRTALDNKFPKVDVVRKLLAIERVRRAVDLTMVSAVFPDDAHHSNEWKEIGELFKPVYAERGVKMPWWSPLSSEPVPERFATNTSNVPSTTNAPSENVPDNANGNSK